MLDKNQLVDEIFEQVDMTELTRGPINMLKRAGTQIKKGILSRVAGQKNIPKMHKVEVAVLNSISKGVKDNINKAIKKSGKGKLSRHWLTRQGLGKLFDASTRGLSSDKTKLGKKIRRSADLMYKIAR